MARHEDRDASTSRRREPSKERARAIWASYMAAMTCVNDASMLGSASQNNGESSVVCERWG